MTSRGLGERRAVEADLLGDPLGQQPGRQSRSDVPGGSRRGGRPPTISTGRSRLGGPARAMISRLRSSAHCRSSNTRIVGGRARPGSAPRRRRPACGVRAPASPWRRAPVEHRGASVRESGRPPHRAGQVEHERRRDVVVLRREVPPADPRSPRAAGAPDGRPPRAGSCRCRPRRRAAGTGRARRPPRRGGGRRARAARRDRRGAG